MKDTCFLRLTECRYANVPALHSHSFVQRRSSWCYGTRFCQYSLLAHSLCRQSFLQWIKLAACMLFQIWIRFDLFSLHFVIWKLNSYSSITERIYYTTSSNFLPLQIYKNLKYGHTNIPVPVGPTNSTCFWWVTRTCNKYE